MNPYAVTSATNTSVSIGVSGLANSTKYYYLVRGAALSGDLAGQSVLLGGDATTLNVVPVVTPTPTPVVTPTPTPIASPSPTPVVTPTPTPSPTPSTSPGVKAPQSITFPALAPRSFDGVGTPLLAKSSSGLPITYTVTGECQILNLSNGNVSTQPKYPIVGTPDPMTCTFTANQAGNASYLAATPVSQSLVFTRDTTQVRITPPTTITTSGNFMWANYVITSGRGNGNLGMQGMSFTNTTPVVCSIDQQTSEDYTKGERVTVRARTNGVCTINVNFAGTSDYKPSSASWSFTINGVNTPAPGSNASQTIIFPELVDWVPARAQQLNAKASSGLPITYVSLTPDICWIIYPSSGPVVQRQPSSKLVDAPSWTCTVRAIQQGDDRYAAAPNVDRSFKFLKAPMVIGVISGSSLSGVGPHQVISTIGYVDKNEMSGLTSLGHLLTVVSLTPDVCKVNSNELWDRTGGIVNRTYVAGLKNGTCSLKFDFAGTKDRAPTSLTWNGTVSSVPVPTGSSITLQAISGNIVNGKETVGLMSTSAPAMYLSGMDKGRVQINVAVKPLDSTATMGVDSRGTYSENLASSMKITILTPTTCNFQTNSPTAVTSLNGGGPAYVMPIALGTCSVRFDFAGIPAYQVGASSVTWTAIVNK